MDRSLPFGLSGERDLHYELCRWLAEIHHARLTGTKDDEDFATFIYEEYEQLAKELKD